MVSNAIHLTIPFSNRKKLKVSQHSCPVLPEEYINSVLTFHLSKQRHAKITSHSTIVILTTSKIARFAASSLEI